MNKKIKGIHSVTVTDEIHEIVKENATRLDVSISSIYEAAIIRFFGIKQIANGQYRQTKNARIERKIS